MDNFIDRTTADGRFDFSEWVRAYAKYLDEQVGAGQVPPPGAGHRRLLGAGRCWAANGRWQILGRCWVQSGCQVAVAVVHGKQAGSWRGG